MTVLHGEAIMLKEVRKKRQHQCSSKGGQKHNQGNFNRNLEAWIDSERIGR